tara:strand:+ start:12480 stop:13745 length:1266 start_codon:yes stop_codon:yes gene_type:complete
MTSGIIQLVSSSDSTPFLTGNPQITFFKSLYKAYSNFYITQIEQQINGTPNFGNTINCILSKSGDLLKNIYLDITLPDLNKPTSTSWYGYTNNIGCNIIDNISFKINDIIIDKLYGESIDIYNNIYGNDVTDLVLEYNSEHSIRNTGSSIPLEKRHCYIKLPFWFSKNTGSALPLIALNNSNISIDIEFRKMIDVIKIDNYNNLGNVTIKSDSEFECKIFTECIYLDEKEKQFFSTQPHEYLIEQLQYNGDDTITRFEKKKDIFLNFRKPVKEIFWVISTDNTNIDINLQNDYNNISKYTSYYSNYKDTFDTLTIKLNSMNLLENEKSHYFRILQSNLYHNLNRKKYIYSYSFSLNPDKFQPSGALNFSDLNDALFSFTFKNNDANTLIDSGCSTNGIIKIFAYNYNILKIVSGQASVGFI